MLETYADRPLTTQLAVKRDFVHSEIGASADLRMDKVELSSEIGVNYLFSMPPESTVTTATNASLRAKRLRIARTKVGALSAAPAARASSISAKYQPI